MSRTSFEKQEFWRFALWEQSRSGLSIREFCRRDGMSEPSLYMWRKRLAPAIESDNGQQEPESQP
jgi:transposase